MKHFVKVSTLRDLIEKRESPIKKVPGIYRWWFDADATNRLLSELKFKDFHKLMYREIDGTKYYALYFGISNDMRGRANWHICQSHSTSQIKHGTLSTLRQTLSGLLGIDMSKSRQCINDLMDNSCYLEYDYVSDPKTYEGQELKGYNNYAYPLNIQENKTIDKYHIKLLKDLRKKHRR